jgi:hypothetical protein
MPEEVIEQVEDKVDETTTSEVETEETADSTESQEETQDEQVEINKEDYNLLLLLKNPDTRNATIQALLQHQGVTFPDRKTETTVTKSLGDEIKEMMGDDFDQVPTKLWPTIEKMLDKKVQAVESRIQENARIQIERESQAATEKLLNKYNDVAKYEADMAKLMKIYSPSNGQPQYEYLQDIYFLAKSKRSAVPSIQAKVNARIRQNSKEVNISSKGADERNIRTGSKPFISAREAVELALRGKKVE